MTQMHVADYFSKLQTVSPIAYAMFNPHLASMFPERNFAKRPVRWGECAYPVERLLRQFPYVVHLGQHGILLKDEEVEKYVLKYVPDVVMPDVRTIKCRTKEISTQLLDDILVGRNLK